VDKAPEEYPGEEHTAIKRAFHTIEFNKRRFEACRRELSHAQDLLSSSFEKLSTYFRTPGGVSFAAACNAVEIQHGGMGSAVMRQVARSIPQSTQGHQKQASFVEVQPDQAPWSIIKEAIKLASSIHANQSELDNLAQHVIKKAEAEILPFDQRPGKSILGLALPTTNEKQSSMAPLYGAGAGLAGGGLLHYLKNKDKDEDEERSSLLGDLALPTTLGLAGGLGYDAIPGLQPKSESSVTSTMTYYGPDGKPTPDGKPYKKPVPPGVVSGVDLSPDGDEYMENLTEDRLNSMTLDEIEAENQEAGEKQAFGSLYALSHLLGKSPRYQRGVSAELDAEDEKVQDYIEELDSPTHADDLKRIRIRAQLENMMANDATISTHDPAMVSEAYNEIVQLSPSAADSPLLMRNLLRQYLVNGGEMDPRDISSNILGNEKALQDVQQGRPGLEAPGAGVASLTAGADKGFKTEDDARDKNPNPKKPKMPWYDRASDRMEEGRKKYEADKAAKAAKAKAKAEAEALARQNAGNPPATAAI
jgi:LPXTG-motif cell wall-anchored protein